MNNDRSAAAMNRPAPVRACNGMKRYLALFGTLFAVALSGCSGGSPAITSCEPAAGLTPDCRFSNPEDLVATPSGNAMIVSQYSDMAGSRAGSLVEFNPGTGAIKPLFPAAGTVSPIEGWGELDCPPPEPKRFAPHGIDQAQLITGEEVLYVVNHGGRESIEMFEIAASGELVWRGCVMAPEDGFFNDLVVLRSGEFRVTQMYPKSANALWSFLRMQFSDYAPGFVYHWSPAFGFERLSGSDAQFANGVAQTADERMLFVNSYLGNEVIKVDVETGKRVGSVPVESPDNLSWSPTGELLVASHLASVRDTLACGELETGNCGFAFRIVAIDPETLSQRTILEHAGPPMGAATVALPLGDGLYLGTFAGDRITRAPATLLSPPASASGDAVTLPDKPSPHRS
jgi:hypothetical protein